MISFKNKPKNFVTSNQDFTIKAYIKLLEIIKSKFDVITYRECCEKNKFILWRHDVDYSLQHAFSLAKLENQQGIHATYFINIHSDFYNALASDETEIIRKIKRLGHDIGIHLDASYYKVNGVSDLERALEIELQIFEKLLGSRPNVFSFHNPNETHLAFDAQQYAGLINCYSTFFKQEVDYVSDSNGYWRFKSIHDVLERQQSNKLQVLTHPGWWQEEPDHPRERILKISFQRAADTIRNYDNQLKLDNRENLTRVPRNLLSIIKLDSPISLRLDFLFHQKLYEQIYIIFYDFLLTQDSKTILQIALQLFESEESEYTGFLHAELNEKNKLSGLESFKGLSTEEKIYMLDKLSLVYFHFVQGQNC